MNGGRLRARAERKRKRNLARAENIAILALAVAALFLAGKTGMLQNTLPALGAGQTVEGGYTVGPAIALTGQTPVRLMIRENGDRRGVEYDQDTVDRLYDTGLSSLLDSSLRSMETPTAVGEEVWQDAVIDSDRWVFYDYFNDIVFDQQADQSSGSGRFFLVTGKGNQAEELYYFNETDRRYYSGKIKDPVAFPDLDQAPNDAKFAFEDPECAQILSPNMMVLAEAPVCMIYTADDPLLHMDDRGWNDLLEALGFNAKAVSPYTTATGSVIREGADTLRIMNDGTLQFHGSDSGENRYVALSSRKKDQQLRAEEIIDRATADTRGPARICCRSIRTLEDGQTELIFSYLLDGARVQMWGEGWAARFLFRDNVVTAYTILTRSFTETEIRIPLLPARQAGAAAAAMGRRGAELQVVYQDSGDQEVIAGWTVREPR